MEKVSGGSRPKIKLDRNPNNKEKPGKNKGNYLINELHRQQGERANLYNAIVWRPPITGQCQIFDNVLAKFITYEAAKSNGGSGLERFAREIELLKLAEKSRYVVDLLDVDPQEKPTYYIMELIQGQTILQFLQHRLFSEKEAVTAMLQIAKGLRVFERKSIMLGGDGFCHRDLSLNNLMFDRKGQTWKILDPGYSHGPNILTRSMSEQSITAEAGNIFCGHPRWMAPEAWRGIKETDEMTDIFAIGALLCLMITGKTHKTLKAQNFVKSPIESLQQLINNIKKFYSNKPTNISTLTWEFITSCMYPANQKKRLDLASIHKIMKEEGTPPYQLPSAYKVLESKLEILYDKL